MIYGCQRLLKPGAVYADVPMYGEDGKLQGRYPVRVIRHATPEEWAEGVRAGGDEPQGDVTGFHFYEIEVAD